MSACLRSAVLAAAVLASAPAAALELEAMEKAGNLANLLASEEVCGLAYDHDAIVAWIDAQPEAADPGFSNYVTGAVRPAALGLRNLSGSQKVAHCRSVERAALALGFVKG